MKRINTKVHGTLDYAVALLLIALPLLTDINNGTSVASRIMIIAGIFTIAYSLLTDYEYGLIKFIPMEAHLFLDILQAVVLISSPWIFGFRDVVYLPHMLIGIVEILVVILTKPRILKKQKSKYSF